MSEEKFYFSFSSMSKLIRDPKLFHKEYILKEREISEARYFKDGGVMHCLLLEPEMFDEQFVIMPAKLPYETVMDVIRHVITEHVKEFENFEDAPEMTREDFDKKVDERCSEVKVYQSNKYETRIAKFHTNEANQYKEVLIESIIENKVIVDQKVLETSTRKAEILKQNSKFNELITEQNSKVTVRTELELKMELPNYPFGLKGVLDIVRIDYKRKTITIVDVKSTSKSLDAWHKGFSISEYMYWLQVIVYKELILSLVPKESAHDWKLKVWFPVIDKNDNAYCFPVSTKSLREWEIKTKRVFEIAQWHLENESYDLPYEYVQGLVKL